MARNDAQQAAAQVTETRDTLAKQGYRKGLAEGVRKDMIKEATRGKGHDSQQMK
jgi:hypothetical protein